MNFNIDFDAVKEKVGNIAQAGVSQSKKLATVAKLKADNMSQQDALRKAYLAIGKQYYAEKSGQVDEAYAALFAKADAALAAIAANNAKLEELKAVEEVVINVDAVDFDAEDEVVVPAAEETSAEAPAEAEPAAEAAPAEEAPVEEAPAAEAPADEANQQ
jgi:hypothetical protein